MCFGGERLKAVFLAGRSSKHLRRHYRRQRATEHNHGRKFCRFFFSLKAIIQELKHELLKEDIIQPPAKPFVAVILSQSNPFRGQREADAEVVN